MKNLIAAFIAAYLILAGVAGAIDEPLPVEPPQLQARTVHILTADERSEILIYDIWKPQELDKIQIGKGAALGIAPIKEAPREPYGWLAVVSQDARSSLIGDMSAFAYQGL